MTSPASPPVGLIGLTHVHGDVGRLIRFGQWLDGGGFSDWEHAFISIGNGLIVEAEPGGARIAHADKYPAIHWCYGIYGLGTENQLWLTEDAAKRYASPGPWGKHGVPYSFLDYLALVLHRFHFSDPGLQRYIASTHHQICSQLVDQCYQDADIQIFNDGRWSGYVTPADLYDRDIELQG